MFWTNLIDPEVTYTLLATFLRELRFANQKRDAAREVLANPNVQHTPKCELLTRRDHCRTGVERGTRTRRFHGFLWAHILVAWEASEFNASLA